MDRSAPRSAETAVPHRNPNLATLASIAAIALDKRVNGNGVSLDPVVEFASALQRTLNEAEHPPTGTNVRSALLDSTTADLFNRALSSLSFVGELRSAPDVVLKAKEVIQQLSVSGTNQTVSLNLLRDFCMALSRVAQAQSAATMAPVAHPFRR